MGIPDILELVNELSPVTLALAIVGLLTLAVFLFGFPRELVMIFAGYQFGIVLGSIINLTGLIIGASIGYFLGKRGRIKAERLKVPIYIKYQRILEQRGIGALTALRLTPFSPHDTISIISGFLRLNQRIYIFVSFFSFIPYAFLWSFVGKNFFNQIISYIPSDYNVSIWFYGFLSFIIIATIFAKFFITTKPQEIDGTPTTS